MKGLLVFDSVSVPVALPLGARKVRHTYGLESDDSMARWRFQVDVADVIGRPDIVLGRANVDVGEALPLGNVLVLCCGRRGNT